MTGRRSASVQWDEVDLAGLRERSRGRTGLAFVQDMVGDRLARPPVAQALGVHVLSAEPGRVRFGLDVRPWMVNHLGVVAGGLLGTALDIALGCAALTTQAADSDIVTLDLDVDFLRPVLAGASDQRLPVEAQVVHDGRRRVLAIGELFDTQGRLCVTGRSSCLVQSKG